ncbi:hypothetical protein [Palleronia caenipelagi]|uniref:Sugar ABC transporter ATP-binding protein n=1 Tax=Palleronia caenipelagi TaxID=2489174 RepID=A0A547PHR0_9RHOB|nr:hypothetical protein [Palleronia caenipelagi]TRD13663.1 hypothetical protein FEV53_20100 [Palleronia caenipelagi]
MDRGKVPRCPVTGTKIITTTFGNKDGIGRMRAGTRLKPGQICEFAVNMDKAVLFNPKSEERIRLD